MVENADGALLAEFGAEVGEMSETLKEEFQGEFTRELLAALDQIHDDIAEELCGVYPMPKNERNERTGAMKEREGTKRKRPPAGARPNGGGGSLRARVERLQGEVERLKRENEVLNRVAVKLHRSRAAALDRGDRLEKAFRAIYKTAIEMVTEAKMALADDQVVKMVHAERRTETPRPNSDGGER